MTMREAVEIVMAGRRAAAQVGLQFIIDDAKLMRLGFTRDQVMDIRRHALEIEDMLEHRLSRISLP